MLVGNILSEQYPVIWVMYMYRNWLLVISSSGISNEDGMGVVTQWVLGSDAAWDASGTKIDPNVGYILL